MIRERENPGVGAYRFSARPRAAGQSQHSLGEIDGDGSANRDIRWLNQKEKSPVPDARSSTTGRSGRLRAFHACAFPCAVHAIGKGAGDEIVSGSDGVNIARMRRRFCFSAGSFTGSRIVSEVAAGRPAGPSDSRLHTNAGTAYRRPLAAIRGSSTEAPADNVPSGGAIDVSTICTMA